MSHLKKILIVFLVVIVFSTVTNNFAQNTYSGYDTSPFAAILSETPCVNIQYDLKPGSRDYYIFGNVMKLQMFLYQNELMAYPPTGFYANYTFDAVMNFQYAIGLTPTGFVDVYTRAAVAQFSCGSSYNPNDFFYQGNSYSNSVPQNNNVNTIQSQNTNNTVTYQTSPVQYYYNPNETIYNSGISVWRCSLNGIDYGNETSYRAGCVSTNTTNNTSVYTVTFNSNGGTTVPSQSVTSGFTLPVTAYTSTKTGYTFDGWYSDFALTNQYSFGSPVTSNITLYAKWAPISSNPSSPSIPLNLVISNVSTSSLTLTWLASTGATGYRITGNNGFVATTTSNLSINLNSLYADTLYTFNIAAYNSYGTSSAMSISTRTTVVATTPTPSSPSIPLNLVISNVSTSSLTLTWLASTGATGYRITGNNGFVATTTSNLSINLNSLYADTLYTFNIAAYNSYGTSSAMSISTRTNTVLTTLEVGNTIQVNICSVIYYYNDYIGDMYSNCLTKTTNIYNFSNPSQNPLPGDYIYIISSAANTANFITLSDNSIKSITNQQTSQIINGQTYRLFLIGQ